jgi:hypothetical protein
MSPKQTISQKLVFPDGREVQVTRVLARGTYSGCLEGTPETLSPHIFNNLPDSVACDLSPGKPLIVIRPSELPLLPLLWVAELESHRGVRTDDPDYGSKLFVCWFTDDLSASILDMMRSLLPSLDWEANAEDYDWTLM